MLGGLANSAQRSKVPRIPTRTILSSTGISRSLGIFRRSRRRSRLPSHRQHSCLAPFLLSLIPFSFIIVIELQAHRGAFCDTYSTTGPLYFRDDRYQLYYRNDDCNVKMLKCIFYLGMSIFYSLGLPASARPTVHLMSPLGFVCGA